MIADNVEGEPSITARRLLASPSTAVASVFGLGSVPYAPGTAGSIAGFPVALALYSLPTAWKIALYTAFFVAAVGICERAGRALGQADPNSIVIDELWAMAVVFDCTTTQGFGAVLAFALFRLFDIVKPWPIGRVDRATRGGLGVMADDALAALYAVLAYWVLQQLGNAIVSGAGSA